MTNTSAPLFVATEPGPPELTGDPHDLQRSSGAAGGARRKAEKRRVELVAMVDRVLDPAIGLCLRALDRRGEDLENSRAEAREIVREALRPVVARGIGDDDATMHRCMRRTAEVALDRLMGRSIQVPLPKDLDLSELLGEGVLAELAPDGRLSLSELQDTVAAARSSDRQTAYVVLAAGLPPHDAATLLGRSEADVRTSLRRIARRLTESHSPAMGVGR